MKNLRHYFAVLLAATTLLTTSCNQTTGSDTKAVAKAEPTNSKIEIPALLPRNGKVGSDMEANKMFNTYQSIKAQIERNPGDYASRLKMADLYIVEARATGNYGYYYPAAIGMIDGVLNENPEKPDDKFRALTSKAVILLSYHKFEEAREVGEKALAINPHNSRVYGILTDANVEMGDYEQAIKMADSMVAIRPDLRSYSRISYLREIHGEVEGAMEALERAIKAGAPGHEETVWSRVTLGNLHENYGELKEAKMQYEMALESRKGYPFALSGLASIEAKNGNNEKAVKLLEEAIENRPEAGFYEDLALVYQQMDRMDEMDRARQMAFTKLKGLAGEEEHAHKGDHQHGEGDDHHSHETKSEHGHSHEVGLEMAKMYVSLTDNYDEALHHALHEYAIRPDNIEVNKVLAYAYLKNDKVKQASEHYDKAVVTHSKDPELMLIGGLIKIKEGNATAGKALIKTGFERNPYLNGAIANDAKKQVKPGAIVAQL